jgi:hypothetical protein
LLGRYKKGSPIRAGGQQIKVVRPEFFLRFFFGFPITALK